MSIKRIILLLFFIPLGIIIGKAQIIDDTTKLAYGPETIDYTFEEHIKYNQIKKYFLDTFPTNTHNVEFVEQSENKYQHLGNLGTALHPLFYEAPTIIGESPGFNAFSPYFKDPSKFKYYDTKSPFTDMLVIFGGKGRSIVDIGFTRNIKPTWNAGINFKRITADKQFGATTSQGDRNVVSTSYNINTGYNSKDSTYQLMFNYSRMGHLQSETGGVIARESFDDLFSTDNPAEIYLSNSNANASSQDLRNNTHLYHQFKVGKGLQLYHIIDRYIQKNTFGDEDMDLVQSSSVDSVYYNTFRFKIDSLNLDSAATLDRSIFSSTTNELGIKGDAGQLFYIFYLKSRLGKMDFDYEEFIQDKKISETYFGTNLRYDLGENTNIDFHGEILFEEGNYKVVGKFENPIVKASYSRFRYSPSLISQNYFGNFYNWNNDFSAISSDILQGEINLEMNGFRFNPKVSVTNLNNYVYYGLDRMPLQANGTIQILSPEINLLWPISKKFFLRNQLIYTLVEGESRDAVRIPELFMNGQIYYENRLFKKDLWLQFGFDFHYKSSYFSNDYDPVLQQFFLQDAVEVENYLLADVFANMKIQRWKFLIKLTNLTQNFVDKGYYVTPYYIGQQRTLDFGIHWVLFD